jgi:hypothetical protein
MADVGNFKELESWGTTKIVFNNFRFGPPELYTFYAYIYLEIYIRLHIHAQAARKRIHNNMYSDYVCSFVDRTLVRQSSLAQHE